MKHARLVLIDGAFEPQGRREKLGLGFKRGNSSMGRWGVDGSQHVLQSVNAGDCESSSGRASTKFLPKTCLNIAALITVLRRWSCCIPTACGLRDAGGHQAANGILDCILMCSLGSKRFVLQARCICVWKLITDPSRQGDTRLLPQAHRGQWRGQEGRGRERDQHSSSTLVAQRRIARWGMRRMAPDQALQTWRTDVARRDR